MEIDMSKVSTSGIYTINIANKFSYVLWNGTNYPEISAFSNCKVLPKNVYSDACTKNFADDSLCVPVRTKNGIAIGEIKVNDYLIKNMEGDIIILDKETFERAFSFVQQSYGMNCNNYPDPRYNDFYKNFYKNQKITSEKR